MTLTKKELNKIALQYHDQDIMKDKFIEDECQFYTYNWVFENLTVGESVLEMGYGEGNFTEELVSRGFKPTVLDGSDALLKKAKNKYGDQINIEHDLFEEYIPKKGFDTILCTHVLEHVDDPVDLLQHMQKWIKDDGKIIIIVPNKESLHRQLAVIMGLQTELDTLGARDKLVGHQRVYSIDTLSKDVLNAKYKINQTTGFFLKSLPNSMMLNYSKDLIIALNKVSTIMPKNLLANIGLIAKK